MRVEIPTCRTRGRESKAFSTREKVVSGKVVNHKEMCFHALYSINHLLLVLHVQKITRLFAFEFSLLSSLNLYHVFYLVCQHVFNTRDGRIVRMSICEAI